MANINISSNGTYTVGDGDKAKIDISGGGNVTLVAPSGNDNVDKFTIEFENNDGQSDVVTVDLSTFDEDDLHIDIKDYDSSDEVVLQGATITGVDPGDSSKLNFTYVGENGNTYSGYIHLKDSGEKNFTDPTSPIIICFCNGSLILTDRGQVPVETLVAGDLLITRDCGLQPILWIGSRKLDSIDLAQCKKMFPVCIRKGALGWNTPTQDLSVSPQHRFCLGGESSQLMFGQEKVLVAAKHMVNGVTIIQDKSVCEVTYFHILLAEHHIIYGNGSPSESLHLSDMAHMAQDQDTFGENSMLFPELADLSDRHNVTALPVLKAYEAKVMMAYLHAA